MNFLDKIKYVFFNIKHKARKINKNNDENELLRQLREKISEINLNDNLAVDLSTSSWENNRKEIRRSILEDNINDFLNWDIIKKTMVYEAPRVEYIEVMKNNFISNYLMESKVGNPKPYYLKSNTSGNLIHHAYSINNLLRKTTLDDFDRVIEFGGGYGSMCRLFRNMNYLKKYIIFDLPEFSALQKFYLSSVKPDYIKETIFTGNIDDLEGEGLNTLFIATWSLSEMPLKLREELLNHFSFNSCVIAFQSEFDGINNVEYFEKFKKLYNKINFKVIPIKHLPEHFYLIGIKR